MGLLSGYIADPVSGQFVSEKHMAVATIIQDYNPDLRLVWIPPAARVELLDKHKEFAIVHSATPQHAEYVVMYASEDEVDERLLARLWLNDTSRHDVLARLEATELAEQMLNAKIEEEAAAARQDIIATVAKSPLHTYKMPSGRKISK